MNSRSFQPAPSASTKRPPLTSAIVAAIFGDSGPRRVEARAGHERAEPDAARVGRRPRRGERASTPSHGGRARARPSLARTSEQVVAEPRSSRSRSRSARRARIATVLAASRRRAPSSGHAEARRPRGLTVVSWRAEISAMRGCRGRAGRRRRSCPSRRARPRRSRRSGRSRGPAAPPLAARSASSKLRVSESSNWRLVGRRARRRGPPGARPARRARRRASAAARASALSSLP